MRPRSIGGDEPQHDDDADVDEDEVCIVFYLFLVCIFYDILLRILKALKQIRREGERPLLASRELPSLPTERPVPQKWMKKMMVAVA